MKRQAGGPENAGGMMGNITSEEYRSLSTAPKRRHKYNAKPIIVDGIRFASKAEGRYYSALKLREKAGEVANVRMQEPFILSVNGKLITTYRADFVFHDLKENRERVVDVKGVQTDVFRIKKKLMRAIHGIEIELA